MQMKEKLLLLELNIVLLQTWFEIILKKFI